MIIKYKETCGQSSKLPVLDDLRFSDRTSRLCLMNSYKILVPKAHFRLCKNTTRSSDVRFPREEKKVPDHKNLKCYIFIQRLPFIAG